MPEGVLLEMKFQAVEDYMIKVIDRIYKEMEMCSFETDAVVSIMQEEFRKYRMDRKTFIEVFKNYINEGNGVSPMNTEPCRKYLQETLRVDVTSEDVLWLVCNVK